MELGVVIVNWNAREDTLASVSRLGAWTSVQTRVWVVDNGSHGPDADDIQRACPEAELVRSNENLGFSGGTNLGLRRVLSEAVDPVLLLNNDVVLEENAVAALMKTLDKHEDCGVLGPIIVHGAEPDRILTAGNRSPIFFRNHALTAPLHDQDPYPVTFVSGAVALVRIQVLEKVGILDESFFFGLELADFCARARKTGFSTLVDPGVGVQHHVERASRYRDSLYVYYVVRNRFLYMRKHNRFLAPLLSAGWAAYGLQQAIRLGRQGRSKTARAIKLGVADGLRGRYGGQNQRVLDLCQQAEQGE